MALVSTNMNNREVKRQAQLIHYSHQKRVEVLGEVCHQDWTISDTSLF
jgi:hypothetical protein